jgi:hypothetical protein
MWNELRKLDKIDKRIHGKFKYGKTLAEIEKEMDIKERNDKQPTLFDFI